MTELEYNEDVLKHAWAYADLNDDHVRIRPHRGGKPHDGYVWFKIIPTLKGELTSLLVDVWECYHNVHIRYYRIQITDEYAFSRRTYLNSHFYTLDDFLKLMVPYGRNEMYEIYLWLERDVLSPSEQITVEENFLTFGCGPYAFLVRKEWQNLYEYTYLVSIFGEGHHETNLQIQTAEEVKSLLSGYFEKTKEQA